MYYTGTISTVSGSAIVRGTGTQFISNINGVAPGQIILIRSGNNNLIHMIQAVNSDTELVLADTIPVTLNNVKYQIQTTVPNSISDGVRHILANASYITLFLQNMDKWMSQDDVVDVTLPNGQTVSLQSIKALYENIAQLNQSIDNRLEKAQNGADIPNKAEFVRNIGLAGTVDQAVNAYPKTGGTIEGKVWTASDIEAKGWIGGSKLYDCHDTGGWSRAYSEAYPPNATQIGALALTGGTVTGDVYATEAIRGAKWVGAGTLWEGKEGAWKRVWSELNSWSDGNGYIRKSSPIVQIYADGKFTTNDESEGATVERLSEGVYLIKNVLGFNADAAWGGVDGGVEIPLCKNKQPLIWVDYKVLPDGSIKIMTYHREHTDAPTFARNTREGYADGDPIDIPAGRSISVRVQMPENSIWNQQQRLSESK
ncbi:hypothetical protein [Xenorhabdus eapokensis]|uniref:NgrE n=1 Tax=Xenorhabdus eapokensis TaxID=1873482 RepID=A0A1Q5TPC9_9GAMM|nr:hypothetical protein [Xenorhabdus eapokensis]OKP02074.1 NgrE [Xenorhabdus eapokensis]